jgi:hypothetical protein
MACGGFPHPKLVQLEFPEDRMWENTLPSSGGKHPVHRLKLVSGMFGKTVKNYEK